MNTEDVKKLAELSRLSLSQEELDSYQKGFDQILEYLDSIKKVNIQHEGAFFVTRNVVREDEDTDSSVNTDDLVAAAPQRDSNYIKVKKII